MSREFRDGATRVIKLGGSLLTWEHWQRALVRWLRRQVPAVNRIVVGGGEIVDELRQLDEQIGLGQQACHQISLGLMRVTAQQTAARLGIDTIHPRNRSAALGVVDVAAGLDDPSFCALAGGVPPSDWSVTSDSLSAWIAQGIGASELVLLKSRDAVGDSLDDWKRDELVDGYFAMAAKSLPQVRIVNLRTVGMVGVEHDHRH